MSTRPAGRAPDRPAEAGDLVSATALPCLPRGRGAAADARLRGPGRLTSALRSGRSGTPACCWRGSRPGRTGSRSASRSVARPPGRSASSWPRSASGPPSGPQLRRAGRCAWSTSRSAAGTSARTASRARAWLDSYDDTWALLRVGAEVRRLAGLIEAARGTRLVPWLTGHPMRALRLADDWDRLLATVRWIEQRQAPGMYLRQVDVPGVDTKFIERHKGVLAELLDAAARPIPGRGRRARLRRALRVPAQAGLRPVPGGRRVPGILRAVGPRERVHRCAPDGRQPGLCDRERDHLPRVPGPGRRRW